MAAQLFALAFCLLAGVVTARDSIFLDAPEGTQTVPVAQYNEELHAFEFYNETVPAPRRKALGLGQSCGVSVTFYNSPGMDCQTGGFISGAYLWPAQI